MTGARHIVFWVFLACSCVLNAQSVFTPTQNKGDVPESFLRDEMDQTAADLSNRKADDLSRKQGQELYANSNFALASFMRSGVVYFGDDYSEYVQKVFEEIRRSNPKLSDDLEIFVTRIWKPNATSWRNGSLFINLGLLSLLENEAQLAFVICHEIAHYEEEHSVRSFRYDVTLKRKKENRLLKKRLTEGEAMFMNLQYSRQNEAEADLEGYKYFKNTGYDLAEAGNALAKLGDIKKDQFSAFLEIEAFLGKDEKKLKEFYKDYVDGIAKGGSRDEEGIDTLFSTHPDIESRIKKLNIGSGTGTGKKYIVGQTTFLELKNRAWYDMVFALYRAHEYEQCFYQCMRLLQEDEGNAYLEATALNSLYWILYKVEKQGQQFEFGAEDYEDIGYNKFLYTLDGLCGDSTALRDFSGLVCKATSKPERNDELYFAWCRLNYLANDDTRYFGKYLQKYPRGMYAQYCEKRDNHDRR